MSEFQSQSPRPKRFSPFDVRRESGETYRQMLTRMAQESGVATPTIDDLIRLDRARHLLIQSSLPVVEVAVACGFVSASHFSKCYRELYARSPQQERVDRKQLLAA